jgi:hypothetical protein
MDKGGGYASSDIVYRHLAPGANEVRFVQHQGDWQLLDRSLFHCDDLIADLEHLADTRAVIAAAHQHEQVTCKSLD